MGAIVSNPIFVRFAEMIVAVHQPQYLPWLGYFDKIDRADVFVLLDTVQYKKNEWQNRNRIKTAAGPQWLTVPVTYRFPQRIDEVGVNNRERWQHKQRQAIVSNYRKAPFWDGLAPLIEEILTPAWEMSCPAQHLRGKETGGDPGYRHPPVRGLGARRVSRGPGRAADRHHEALRGGHLPGRRRRPGLHGS